MHKSDKKQHQRRRWCSWSFARMSFIGGTTEYYLANLFLSTHNGRCTSYEYPYQTYFVQLMTIQTMIWSSRWQLLAAVGSSYKVSEKKKMYKRRRREKREALKKPFLTHCFFPFHVSLPWNRAEGKNRHQWIFFFFFYSLFLKRKNGLQTSGVHSYFQSCWALL